MRRMFAEPVFVTPHAIDRFRQRIAPLSGEQIIEVVHEQLVLGQRVVEPHRADNIAYRGRHGDQWFYMMLTPGEKEWPSVSSIVDASGAEHGNLHKGKAYIVQQSVYDALRIATKGDVPRSRPRKRVRPGAKIGEDKVVALKGRIRIAALIEVAAQTRDKTRKGVWEDLHKATGIFCPFPTASSLNTFFFWHKPRIENEAGKILSGEITEEEALVGWWWGDAAMRVVSRASGGKDEGIERSRDRRVLIKETLADPELTRRVVEQYYRMIEE